LPRWIEIHTTYNLFIASTTPWNYVCTRLVSLPGNGPRAFPIRAHWCDGTEWTWWTFKICDQFSLVARNWHDWKRAWSCVQSYEGINCGSKARCSDVVDVNAAIHRRKIKWTQLESLAYAEEIFIWQSSIFPYKHQQR
jgi:hypothetical protein